MAMSDMLSSVWQDLRYAWRMLSKSPGFVFTAVVSLAIGIGINTSIFSVIHTAMERPVSGREPRELVDLSLRTPAGTMLFSYPEYLELRKRTRVFSDVMALTQNRYRVSGQGKPEMVSALVATPDFFAGFGQRLFLGRGFSQGQAGAGEAVLTHGFWKRRFGADPAVIGRPLVLYAGATPSSYMIVGVLPGDFRYASMWIPDVVLTLPEDPALRKGDVRILTLMARVKPGVGMGAAQAETEVLASQLAAVFPDSFGKARLNFWPKVARDAATRTFAAAVQVVVCLVLLIACANVINLLLARHQARQNEMATRVALGASRGRLTRQLLLESLMLSLPSAVAGYGLAALMIFAVERIDIPGLAGITPYFYLDRKVFGFALCAGVAACLIAGLWPAWAASKPELVPALKGAGTAVGGRKFGLRGALVAAQLAVSMVGITAAAMLGKGAGELASFDPGVDPRRVLVAATWPVINGYTSARAAEFRRQLSLRLGAQAGVEAVTFAAVAPGGGEGRSQRVLNTGSALLPKQDTVLVLSNSVGEGFFRALGIQILRGREFRDADMAGRPVCVVNESMAHRFWPGHDPLGELVRLGGAKGTAHEVIGVARNTAYEKGGNEYSPFLYLPVAAGDYLTILLRTQGDAGHFAATVRRTVAALDPDMPILSLDVLAESPNRGPKATRLRLAAGVMGTLGGTALVLSSLGLYGVIAYLVSRRTREIGIRLALGAGRGDVLRTVLKDGARLVGVGMTVGLAASLGVCPLLASRFVGVTPNHPGVLAAACGLLAAVAAGAMLLPASRACKVEPLAAVRYE
jgi:predicted permease